MENRYQKFLRETLWVGLRELQANPAASEVAGIPIEAFEILVRAFRSGLSEELKITLPHNLMDPAYLEALLSKIDILLSPGIPESATETNTTNIRQLVVAYEDAQKREASFKEQRAGWQAEYNQQIEKYNKDSIFNLQQQLGQIKKERGLSSLTDTKIEVLAKDMARTIQDQALPAINFNYQTKEILESVVQQTINQYVSEIEELSGKPEVVEQISEDIAKSQEATTWEVRSVQISAGPPSTAAKVDFALKTAVAANLPPELAQDPEVVEAIAREIMSRIHGPTDTLDNYQSYLNQTTQGILRLPEYKKTLKEKGITLSPPQEEKISRDLASHFAEKGRNFALSPDSKFIGQLPAPPTPGGPSPPFTGPRDELGDIFFSSGSPGHILTSLASPQAGENLAKWAITGGLLRAPLGFVLESVPGTPKLNYILDLFGPYFKGIKEGFIKELAEAQKLPLGYERKRLEQEATTHLAIISQFEKEKEKKPWLKLAYQGRVGLYRILHPLRYLQMKLMQRSLALGIGVQSLSDIISAYVKYGGYGGAYVTEAVLKNLAVFGLKVVGAKIGLYEVVGVYPHQKYVFKPTYQLKLKIQEAIYKRIPAGVKNLLTKLAAKLGISVSALLGGVGIALSILGFLWKPLKETGKYLLALLAMLIAKYGMPALIGAITGGLAGLLGGGFLGFKLGVAIGTAIAPGIGTVVGGIVGTVLGGFIGFFAGAFAGTGLGILWVNLTGGGIPAIGGLGGGIGAVPSLTPYAAPTLLLAGATVLPVALVTFIVISEPFRGVGEEIGFGSRFIQVTKTVSVGNFVNRDRLPNSVAENSETVTYQLTVDILQPTQPLTDFVVTDKLMVTNAAGSQNFDLGTWDKNTDPQLSQMGTGDSWTKTYTFNLNPSFVDSIFSNTVTVRSAEGETQTVTLSFTIGNPPVETPLGWPVASGCITQGPGGYYSHRGYEAIDMAGPPYLGDPVFATHNGTVTRVVDDQDTATTGYGNHVIITGVGPNGPFETRYAHLQTISVLYGDKVNREDQIGTVGDTGKSDGPHLHYEFRNLKMEPDYIPRSVPACSGSGPIPCPKICW